MKKIEKLFVILFVGMLLMGVSAPNFVSVPNNRAINEIIMMHHAKISYHISDDIINKEVKMTTTISISAGETLEIRNSIVDFSEVDPGVAQALITNQGTLKIINSTIISDLSQDSNSLIYSTSGYLVILNSTFINKHLRIDIDTSSITYVIGLKQEGGTLTLNSSRFINYTRAIVSSSSIVKSIYNNSIINCPFGMHFLHTDNVEIVKNTLRNSFISGINVMGNNVTVRDNLISNDRNLLQGSSAGADRNENVKIFVDITIGIDFEGGDYGTFANNRIINTFKSIYLFNVSHVTIENNYMLTNSGEKEGELQLQSVDYGTIRNNTLLNQWDPIEIYNSRYLLVENNYIENASSGIVLEKVDYLRDIPPEHITIRKNILINAPYTGGENLKNIQIIDNLFNQSSLYVLGDSEDVLVTGNTINDGFIIIADSHNVLVTDNVITSSEIGVIVWASENVTLHNNTIFCFSIPIAVPEILLQNSLVLVFVFAVFLIVIIFLIVRKIRKRRHSKKNK